MKGFIIFALLLFTIIIYGCTTQQKQFSQKIVDSCKKEGKIECHGDCADGFGATAYYDSTNQKFKENGNIYLSKQQKEASFAIHSSSVCGKCYNKFELKAGGKLEEVTCDEFFHVIEEKNISCNGCVDIIVTGCC